MLLDHLKEKIHRLNISENEKDVLLEALQSLPHATDTAEDSRTVVSPHPSQFDGSSIVHHPSKDDWINHSQNIVSTHTEFDSESTSILVRPLEGHNTITIELSHIDTVDESPSTASEIKYSNRYVHIDFLGRGASSTVFKVFDIVLRRIVAIKIMHLDLVSNPNVRSRFIDEGQICAQLQHPNIIPIYDAGTLTDGRGYITMQVITGTPLKQIIQFLHAASTPTHWKPSEAGISFKEVMSYFKQTCKGIAYAHSRYIIHRDLKPHNIMVDEFGGVLVVDWGLAKELPSDHTTFKRYKDKDQGRILGTPAYMSPEQARGDSNLVGCQSDVFALGVILYEILSGRHPFIGNSLDDVLNKIQHEDPPSLHELFPDASPTRLPNALVDICYKAMSKQISDRYQTVLELHDDIFDWITGIENQEKSEEEYQKAHKLQKQALELEHHSEDLWTTAESMFENRGTSSRSIWSIRLKSKQIWREAQQLKKESLSLIEGALLFNPTSSESHQIMALHYAEKIVDMHYEGRESERELHEDLLNKHTLHLTEHNQIILQNFIDHRLQDTTLQIHYSKAKLFGRTPLMRKILHLIESDTRLITLTGPIGIGKTRIALEIYKELNHFGSDVDITYTTLTGAVNVLNVALQIANSLSLHLFSTDPISELQTHFKEHTTLLFLDNSTPFLQPIRKLLTQWQGVDSQLQVVIIGHTPVKVETETIVKVPMLSRLASIELFVQIAKSVNKKLVISEENRTVIERIVNIIDRIPLVVELTALRTRELDLLDLEEQLKTASTMLSSNPSQNSVLQKTFEMTWNILPMEKQIILAQASIFKNGFSFDAAMNVIQCDSIEHDDDLGNILRGIEDLSLLSQTQTLNGVTRFGMLHSLQSFTQSKLRTLQSNTNIPEKIQKILKEVGQRHATYFSQFGTESFLYLLNAEDASAMFEDFIENFENFVFAISNSTGHTKFLCSNAALHICKIQGPTLFGLRLLDTLLQDPDFTESEMQHFLQLQQDFLELSTP